MLYFDIRSLESRPQSIDTVLESTDPVWQTGDTHPDVPGVHMIGRLSSAGPGRFYLSGRFEGTAATECRRCLTEVTVPVADDLHLLFTESDNEDADEDDVVQIPAGQWELDLSSVLRVEWLLAVPGFALCGEECRGLCPSCGTDLNRETCTCLPPSDSRWDALRAVRVSSS